MKKTLLLTCLLTLSMFSFSQQSKDSSKSDSQSKDSSSEKSDEPKLYAKFVPIDKLAPHQLGWRVWFRNEAGYRNVANLPAKWFKNPGAGSNPDSKGVVIYQKGVSPYMQVFYKDDKFAYVKLVVDPHVSSSNGWRFIMTPDEWQEAPGNPYGYVYEPGNLDEDFNVDDLDLTKDARPASDSSQSSGDSSNNSNSQEQKQ